MEKDNIEFKYASSANPERRTREELLHMSKQERLDYKKLMYRRQDIKTGLLPLLKDIVSDSIKYEDFLTYESERDLKEFLLSTYDINKPDCWIEDDFLSIDLKAFFRKMKKHLTGDMFIRIDYNGKYITMKTASAYKVIYNIHFWKNEHIDGIELIKQSDLQNFIHINLYFHKSYDATEIDIRSFGKKWSAKLMQDIKEYLAGKCQKADTDSLGEAFQKRQKELKSLINQGDDCLKQKRYEKAIEAYKKAISLDEKNADIWYILGYAWYGLGYFNNVQDYYDKALEAYQKSIDLDPKSTRGWHGLGIVYLKQECYLKAIKAFQKGIRRDKKDVDMWNGLGDAFFGQECYEEAIGAYQNSINLDDKDPESWNSLGNAYSLQKCYEEAVEAFQKAIQLDENNMYLWSNLGYTYLEQEYYEEAVEAFQKAINLDDKDADSWNGLGNAYREQKRYEEAIEAYQKAIRLDEKFSYLKLEIKKMLQ